jgi:hypothetical protein
MVVRKCDTLTTVFTNGRRQSLMIVSFTNRRWLQVIVSSSVLGLKAPLKLRYYVFKLGFPYKNSRIKLVKLKSQHVLSYTPFLITLVSEHNVYAVIQRDKSLLKGTGEYEKVISLLYSKLKF